MLQTLKLLASVGFKCLLIFTIKGQNQRKVLQKSITPPLSGISLGCRNAFGGAGYLFLSQGLQLFRLALPVVFHDHHGSVDFAHCQVCGCWKNDKLPWKIRPGEMGPCAVGKWEWGTVRKTHRNTRSHAQYSSNGGEDAWKTLSLRAKSLALQ